MDTELELYVPEKPLSQTEIRKRLGFDPPKIFHTRRLRLLIDKAKEGYFDYFSDEQLLEIWEKKQSGRTVKMLIEAVEEVSKGNYVYLIMINREVQAIYTKALKEMCQQCGLDSRFVQESHFYGHPFIDHSVEELRGGNNGF
jgi:hypothetical protein